MQDSKHFSKALDKSLDIFGPFIKEMIYRSFEDIGIFLVPPCPNWEQIEKALIKTIGPVGASISVKRLKEELAT